MKGQVDFDERRMSEMSFDDVVSEADKLVKELNVLVVLNMRLDVLMCQAMIQCVASILIIL